MLVLTYVEGFCHPRTESVAMTRMDMVRDEMEIMVRNPRDAAISPAIWDAKDAIQLAGGWRD